MANGKWGQADNARTKAAFLTDEEGNPITVLNAIVAATVTAVPAATVNVAGGSIIVSGTVNTVGGSGLATVNVAGGLISIDNIPTVNVGSTVVVSGTVNTVGGTGQS